VRQHSARWTAASRGATPGAASTRAAGLRSRNAASTEAPLTPSRWRGAPWHQRGALPLEALNHVHLPQRASGRAGGSSPRRRTRRARPSARRRQARPAEVIVQLRSRGRPPRPGGAARRAPGWRAGETVPPGGGVVRSPGGSARNGSTARNSERRPSGGSSTRAMPTCIGVVGVSSGQEAASMPTRDRITSSYPSLPARHLGPRDRGRPQPQVPECPKPPVPRSEDPRPSAGTSSKATWSAPAGSPAGRCGPPAGLRSHRRDRGHRGRPGARPDSPSRPTLVWLRQVNPVPGRQAAAGQHEPGGSPRGWRPPLPSDHGPATRQASTTSWPRQQSAPAPGAARTRGTGRSGSSWCRGTAQHPPDLQRPSRPGR